MLGFIFNHIIIWTLLQHLSFVVAIRPLNQKPNVNAKQTFLSELKITKNNNNYVQAERNQNPNIKFIDTLVDETIRSDSNILNKLPNKSSSSNSSYRPTGVWNIVFAPHITKISSLFLAQFDVYYIFDDVKNIKTQSKSNSESINISSSVKYKSKLFGSGWLNTKGTLRYIDGNKKCQILWENVWWDFNDKKPTDVKDTQNHVLPNFIQKVGLLFFIQAVSIFPINYIDDDLCIFLFSLSGTRICSIKKSNSAILPESYLS